MKNKKHEIEKVCARCELAAPLVDEDTVLCKKRGVVSASASCRKFRYDPLKRNPAPPPSVEKADISLD